MQKEWTNEERRQWLEAAMEKYEESLLRLCFAYLKDRALAEYAAQETFLKAFRGLSKYRGDSDEKTWLTRIAMNTCRDIRRSAWFRHVDRGAGLDSLPEPSIPFTPRDDTLVRSIMGLARRHREVILLHYYQDLTVQEIASVLGLSRSAVYNRLEKAQSILKSELKEWYEDE